MEEEAKEKCWNQKITTTLKGSLQIFPKSSSTTWYFQILECFQVYNETQKIFNSHKEIEIWNKSLSYMQNHWEPQKNCENLGYGRISKSLLRESSTKSISIEILNYDCMIEDFKEIWRSINNFSSDFQATWFKRKETFKLRSS